MSFQDTRGFLLLNGLAPRDRRAILIGVTILFPAIVYVFGVKPYLAALSDVRDRVAIEQVALAGELDLLEAAGALPDEIQRASAEANRYENRLVRAPSQVLAEAALSAFLESSASRTRVLLEEIRGGELGGDEGPPPGISLIRLHLRGESDLEGVMNFLDEIERSQLLLRVRGLALEPEVARPESENDEEDNREPVPTGVVEFQLIVDGFARVEEYGS